MVQMDAGDRGECGDALSQRVVFLSQRLNLLMRRLVSPLFLLKSLPHLLGDHLLHLALRFHSLHRRGDIPKDRRQQRPVRKFRHRPPHAARGRRKSSAPIAIRIAEATAVAKVYCRFDGLPAVVDLSHEVIFRITRDIHDRYVHPKTIHAEFTATYGDDLPEDVSKMLDAWAEQLSQYLTSEARDLSDQIYRDLEAEWDDLNSDDTVAEAITGNEWHFDEDGNFLPDRPRELQTAA